MARLVGRENVKELESLESLGFCVIYIYPGAHKFSLSISHLSWDPQTLLSHHYPYFPSLTLSISNSLLSFTQPNKDIACLVVGKFVKELEMKRVRWKVGVMMRE